MPIGKVGGDSEVKSAMDIDISSNSGKDGSVLGTAHLSSSVSQSQVSEASRSMSVQVTQPSAESSSTYLLEDESLYCFMKALNLGDLDKIEELLKENLDLGVTKVNAHGDTAFMLAVKMGESQVVRLLALAGAHVNEKSPKEGLTPLMLACEMNHFEIVKVLIDLNNENKIELDLSLCSSTGMNALDYAVNSRSLDILGYLLDTTSYQAKDALIAASKWGYSETVRWLLSRDVDIINCRERNTKRTPLIYACLKGNFEVVKVLIEEAKVNPKLLKLDSRDKDYRNALFYAASASRNVAIVEYLLEKTSIKANEKYNISDDECESLLIYMVLGDHLEMVNTLLKYVERIDINAQNNRGFSALHLTIVSGFNDSRLEIAKSLIKSGADVNMPEDENGYTPLISAIILQDKDMVELLLDQASLDMRKTDKNGFNALWHAMSGKDQSIHQLLQRRLRHQM